MNSILHCLHVFSLTSEDATDGRAGEARRPKHTLDGAYLQHHFGQKIDVVATREPALVEGMGIPEIVRTNPKEPLLLRNPSRARRKQNLTKV